MRTVGRPLALVVVAALLAACSGSSKSPAPSPPPTTGATTTKLAYVYAGDIYVQALPDGSPQRLTNDGANKSPKWSPSGDWLLFAGASSNLVIRSDGSGRREVAAASWAPNADVLVSFDSRGKVEIENADGSGHLEIAIASPPVAVSEPGPGSAALSPDGEWIAYQASGRLPGVVPPFAYDDIWRVRIDGSDYRELFNTCSPSADGLVLIAWSADNAHIIFQRDIEHSASAIADGLPLEAVPADGGSVQQITSGMLAGVGFEYQPDGALIAITDGSDRETWTNKRVAVFDPAHGAVASLTSETEAALWPAWSPDGTRIAYSSAPGARDIGGGEAARQAMAQRRIWLMEADGSGKRQVTSDGAYRDERPRWSADGSQIVFARIDAEDRASLWVVASAGGDPRQIVDDLSPNPDAGVPFWFGYYGKIDWGALFDVSSQP
jgi:Tol biopolymer transport system component